MESVELGASKSVEQGLREMRIILVGTTHPGNIGASARAMKVMGIDQLRLVEPHHFPSAEATARAAGADDILAAASIHDSLADAISDCQVVYGTTARSRRIDWPVVTPRQAASEIEALDGSCAIVFGRERSGLSNEELDLCQRAINIPTAADYRSLNLAQAVQICAYELRAAYLDKPAPVEPAEVSARGDSLASAVELEQLRGHCLTVMERIEYHDPARPKLLDRRLRRLLNRAQLRHSEVQIVRGVLSAMESKLKRLETSSD